MDKYSSVDKSCVLVAPGSTDEVESRVESFRLVERIGSSEEGVLELDCGKFSVQTTFEYLIMLPPGISIR